VYLPNKQHQCGKQLKTDHDILKMTEILNSRDGAIQHIWKTIDAIYSIKSNVAIKHTHTHTFCNQKLFYKQLLSLPTLAVNCLGTV